MSQVTRDINNALIILLLAEGMTRGYAFGHSIFYATAVESAPGTDKTITIPEGQSAKESVQLLHDVGLISNELAVEIQLKFYDYKIQPGTYTLNTSMTSKEILQVLNEKKTEETKDGSAS